MTVSYMHRAELMRDGLRRREIDDAVRDGLLIRARRDHYLAGNTADDFVRAVRVGGRLSCLSLLAVLVGGFFTRFRLRFARRAEARGGA